MAITSLLVPAVVLAIQPNPGDLPAPTGLTVTDLSFDWDDVVGAEKYSLDIEGTVRYWVYDEILLVDVETEAEVELSFGTSDRTDGGLMSDSDLTISIDDLAAAIAAQLGVDVGDLISLDGSAAVKALDPGKGHGAQNNPFSSSVDVDVDF